MSAENQQPLLEVQDLIVRFKGARPLAAVIARKPRPMVHAVEGVSFSIRRGEMLALVGESGSGKTTTALSVLRMIDAVSGSIRFDGVEIGTMSHGQLRSLRQRMQLIYQDPYESLDPRFKVGQTVEEPLLIHRIGHSRPERRRLVRDALTRVGLSPPELFLDRFPHELSGGQRQRVAIAAALALEPELLVADEPVSMLDVSVRAEILSLLDSLRQAGLAVLMITHDLSTAASYADRIAVMYLGRIVEMGAASRVIADPQHPYTQALISVVPRFDPSERTEWQVLKGETPNPENVPSGCRFHPRCPSAFGRCSLDDPVELFSTGIDSHRAACWLISDQTHGD